MTTTAIITAKIREAISLTDAMLNCAKTQEWDELEELSKLRDRIFLQAFPENFPENLALMARESIENIKQMDGEIVALAKTCQTDSAKQLRNFHKGNKAAKSYQQHK